MARPRRTRKPAFDRPTRSLIVPRLLRRTMAAAYLSISPSQFDLLRRTGEIRPVPVPSDRSKTGVMEGAILFDKHDLDALIERWKEGRNVT